MSSRIANTSLALMVLCLLVAAALRFPDLQAAPPGLHYDEAANGILAGDIGLRGERPIFISSYTGKEALFFYLAGSLLRALGESIFSLRLTAAYAGILTVAATYWLGREMLADRRQALLAAALLAVSFWHVLFSRLGFRAITEPLLQALAIAALFRGLRRDDKRWLSGAGVLLGLTAYTYLAARVFPLLVGLGLLPLILGEKRRLRWKQVGVFLGAALLTLLPLLFYFVANPDSFWVRIDQVAPAATPGATSLAVWSSLLQSWGMFFLRGDPFLRFNLPGRPLFGWLAGGLLVVGWLISLLRWRRFPYDWQRSAIAILVFTPIIMILPTALATNELVPSNLRAIGLIPFIFYLPAIGFVILFADLEKRFGFPPLQLAVLVALMLVLLSGGLSTAQAYFLDWAQTPDLLYETDGDLSAVSQFLNQQEVTGRTVYVAAPHYRHPTVAFLSNKYEDVKWLPESKAIVLPAEGSSLYIFPHNSPRPSWAEDVLAQATRISQADSDYPDDAYAAYELQSVPDLPIPNPVGTDFGGVVTLLGYDTAGPIASGSDIDLTLYWRVDDLPDADYQPFVQLEDSAGFRWSQEEALAYPAEQWQPGEIIIQQVQIPVPPGTPPGDYRLRIGLFDQATAVRAPRLDVDGGYAGDSILISGIPIQTGPLPQELPRPPFVVEENGTGALELIGYERGPRSVFTGESWGMALWWLASANLDPLTTHLELIDRAGDAHPILVGQPVYGSYPFETWQTPQFVIDRQELTIPVDLPEDDYRLQLRLTGADEETLYSADLGPLEVARTERLFTPPPYAYASASVFGDEVELLGYDLDPLQDGLSVLTLIWHARQQPAADYTVFVHLLHPDGRCCVWQQDSTPLSGTYPTSRWLPGEVVVDEYEVAPPSDLPQGTYPLEVGLYIAETGQRLGLKNGTGDALPLQPLRVP